MIKSRQFLKPNTYYLIPNTQYSIPNTQDKLLTCFIFLCAIFISSCANQLPPSGGEDDKTPPKIISISPKPSTTNFKNNVIVFRFDEYVDRRSFEESFFISPKPKGEMSFDWSGKDVEVEFSKSLDKDKTYLVIIGKDLRDVRGSNTLESPFSFAFSTGNKIDEGSISGQVFADNNERVKILAYLKVGKSENDLNPEKSIPDYILQVNPDGSFELQNLSQGNYRMFAITDEDRDNLFGKGFEKIGILSDDLQLSSDTGTVRDVNFLLTDFGLDKNDINFSKNFKADSLNFVYSNLVEGEKGIIPDSRFYFKFSNNTLTKSDIVNNFTITDSANNKSYRLVFNWLNDSLLEVFSTEKFTQSSDLKIKIDLSKTSKKYIYERNISTVGSNRFGKVTGRIISNDTITSPVYIKLYNKNNSLITYSSRITDTTGFVFNEVLEGDYILFSFIDENDNGNYDKGNYYPFRSAESFIVYGKEIQVKGGWNVENVFLEY